MSGRIRVVLVLVMTGFGTSAAAYDYLPFKMLNTTSNPFEYYFDARTSNPAGLLLSDVEAATLAAWNSWDNLTCASTAFHYAGHAGAPIQNPADPYDVYNVSTLWVEDANDPAYHLGFYASEAVSLALTLSYAGVLQQCDIYLNAVDYPWSTALSPGTLDVQSAVVHEVGHCQGIDDFYGVTSADVMFYALPVGIARRTLTTSDIAALCERSPSSGAMGSPCSGNNCGSTSGLKCILPPGGDGGVGNSVCSQGCPLNQNYQCPIPYICRPSSEFAPSFDGACVPPGDYVTQVGKPCDDNAECGSSNGVCQDPIALPSGFAGWAGGYCTQDCSANRPACPAGSSCVDFNGVLACVKQCRLGLGECRPGYSCVLPSVGSSGVCVPSCHTDADCGGPGFQCRTCDGTCMALQSPSGQIGDLCSASNVCGVGQVCAIFENSNQGLCSQSCGRACAACPGGSSCHPIGSQGQFYCLRDCTDGTCPAGLQCGHLDTGRGCIPPCHSDTECPVGNVCSAGTCVNPFADGGCALCPTGDGGSTPHSDGGGADTPAPNSPGCGCHQSSSLFALSALFFFTALRAGRRTWHRT